ncbi:leiomodin 1a (smooth muscle) [Myripristis murdjan]|uniref:leiomodin 1a (smooth muscle) n=1 Tax=Myripristis murdjan TaxID=586833 RepID=UPI001176208F|nr:leiomodin-1-like [Myripristis murdjan]
MNTASCIPPGPLIMSKAGDKSSVEGEDEIDRLLASLTAAEVEELENELMDIDPDPAVPVGLRQRNQTEKKPSVQYNREAMLDFCEQETRRLIQREMSFEGEPKTDREREGSQNTTEMGKGDSCDTLTIPDDCGGINTDPSDLDMNTNTRSEDKKDKLKNKQWKCAGVFQGNSREESHRKLVEVEDSNVKRELEDIWINKEGTLEVMGRSKEPVKQKRRGSKTYDLMSKLQRKNDTEVERHRKEVRERTDSKTKELISKLQDQGEKEEIRGMDKHQIRQKLKDSKTRGLHPDKEWHSEQKESILKENKVSEGDYHKDNKHSLKKTCEPQDGRPRDKKTVANSSNKYETDHGKQRGSNSKEFPTGVKEEDADDASSMFDELLERVRKNDPSLTELNINNSDTIKIQTLIQFAEALENNVHVKTLALANTRADDHVAYAISGALQSNTCLTNINLDSNHLTGKGILSLVHAIQNNKSVTELRFHNQRHICGGKTEMEMIKVLKDNTTLLKLGYQFELAGPRVTVTNILSRNIDQQRQRRLLEQKQAAQSCLKSPSFQQIPPSRQMTLKSLLHVQQGSKEKNMSSLLKEKGSIVKTPNLSSTDPSLKTCIKVTPKVKGGQSGQVSAPSSPPAQKFEGLLSQSKLDRLTSRQTGGRNSRDQLLDSICNSAIKALKKVDVPKRLR